MSRFAQDLRYAIRILGKSPGFLAVAIFTLAVGIGANTAIFSVANALLLRPLPFARPDRLVAISAGRKASRADRGPLSWPRYTMIAASQRSFRAVAAFTRETFNLTCSGAPAQIEAARVSWNFFDVLGVQPAAGRWFRAEEDTPAGDPVIVISHGVWMRRFAGSPGVIGRHVTLDARDYTIVGVTPPAFRFGLLGATTDIYAPRVIDLNLITPAQALAGTGFLNLVARLRDGVAIQRAQAEMDTLAVQYRSQNAKFPDADPNLQVRVGSLRDETVSGLRAAVLILFGAVGLVLLIACANVSSLLLSRAVGRQREIAVRLAIGASRAALVRQLLTESLLLALAGGALGAGLSLWGTRVLGGMARASLAPAGEIRADATVLAFTAAVSVLAGLVFGLAPALAVSRPDLNAVLRSEGRGATAGRRRNRFRSLLVISQVALSTVLLIGAALLVRSFLELRATSAGFDTGHLLTMNITLPPARYGRGALMIAFYDRLLRQVRGVPGVRAATVSSALPLNLTRVSPALPEGQPAVPLAERPLFNIQTFEPGYVETMRVPLLAGREFSERDDAQAPKVVMVNQTLARQFWPLENPIGKHILVGRATAPSEVIGMLGDVRNASLAADVSPEIHLPFAQLPWASMNLVVRTAGDPRGFTAAVRGRVLAVDQDQPVTAVATMEEVLEQGAAQPRFTAWLLSALAGIALVLAVVGIYGAIAYSVAERTQEMGVRLALGAGRADILRLVLRQGLVLALSGTLVGLAASLGLTRLLASQVYRVSVTDPTTFAGCTLVFAAVAALASYLPARRAMRVDPMAALRWE
ncbi:MAG: ABC transporter permease [Bryobacteraceae bacterium]